MPAIIEIILKGGLIAACLLIFLGAVELVFIVWGNKANRGKS